MKIIWILLFIISTSSLFASNPNYTDRVILKLRPGVSADTVLDGTKFRHLFGRMYVLDSASSEVIESFKNSKNVEYVQRDQKSLKTSLPVVEVMGPSFEVDRGRGYFNDPKISKKWSFKDASRKGVSVSRTYEELGPSLGETIIVAVVDTGVDYLHKDLADVMWVNNGEIPGNGVDDDGNGYIDDIHGINTLIRDSNGKATVDMMDGDTHGTHVSGIIGAAHNNSIGVAGVASNVRIMGIRTVPNRGDETDVDVIEAFLYAARNGAKVINCSFGKRVNEGGMAVNDTINHIGKEFGVLVVVASGNDSSNIDRRATYPASFDSNYLFVIASTTSSGGYSYFSNYGKIGVDIAAPGSSIYSTLPRNRYGSMSGTSMASPTAAGVAAEVLSRFPHLTPLELKQVLMDSSVKMSSRRSGKTVTDGRIDLFDSLMILN